jgi:hypothetical protein
MLRWIPLTVLCVFAYLIAGCSTGTGGNGNQIDPTVRVLNASPDSIDLEFLLNDNVHGTPVSYLESSPNFIAFDPEILDVSIRETGTTVDLWSQAVNFQSDNHYLLVAVGLETFTGEFEKRLQLAVVNVNRDTPNGNKARVYVLHGFLRELGFQTPSIDFQTPGSNPQFQLTNIAFADDKNFEVDSGVQTFEARRTATQNILATTTVTLDPGKIYVAVFSGIENAAPPQNPKITFIELQTE